MKRILVLGSLNMDFVQQVPRIPLPGETLRGGGLQTFVGGKGANQACAAALLGGQVSMAGKVGADVFGQRLVTELQRAGVNTELVQNSAASTGSATIFVLPNGENAIVISAGANADISVAFARDAVEGLKPGDLLLCQLEIPLEAVRAALNAAREKGVIAILDPAPACTLPDELLSQVAILTPNQTEAAILLGSDPPTDWAQAERVARALQGHGAETVIVKMGADGCFIAHDDVTIATPGFRVPVKDTTAAGDVFNGALAAALSRGATLADSAGFANAAAALSVTKAGAIASIPRLAQVEDFLLSQAAAV
jgi:ribokinase